MLTKLPTMPLVKSQMSMFPLKTLLSVSGDRTPFHPFITTSITPEKKSTAKWPDALTKVIPLASLYIADVKLLIRFSSPTNVYESSVILQSCGVVKEEIKILKKLIFSYRNRLQNDQQRCLE